jgi:sugar/nucleoside kinase (ribokinase family)
VDDADRSRWESVIGPCLPHLDYYIPSEPEASALTGCREPADIARAILAAGCKTVVIKLAERGAFYALPDGRQDRVPAFRVEHVVDTTGAGDSWAAGFIAGLHRQMTLHEAVELANATAAMDIACAGAASGVRPLEEVLAFARSQPRGD